MNGSADAAFNNGFGFDGSGGNSEPPLLKFMGFRAGFIPEFETRLLDGHGAMTPGPFIMYPTGGAADKDYNTHEQGHALQFWLMGPAMYYTAVVVPSLITAATMTREQHMEMPWEKSATTLWYWFSGQSDPINPHF